MNRMTFSSKALMPGLRESVLNSDIKVIGLLVF